MASSKKTAAQAVKENPKIKTRAMGTKGEKQALMLEYYVARQSTPKLNADGTPMLYTDGKMAGKPMYEVKHIRKYERLNGLYLYTNPKTAEEREHNKSTLVLAKSIREEREKKFNLDRYGYAIELHRELDFVSYFRKFIAEYNKADKRNVNLALRRFEAFLQEKQDKFVVSKEAVLNADGSEKKDKDGNVVYKYEYSFKPDNLTEAIAREFMAYLEEHSKYSGAATIWARFKKVVAAAYKQGVIKSNPCKLIGSNEQPKDNAEEKLPLTAEQLQMLINTHYPGENTDIQRAFIFCCLAGLRWCDCKELTYTNVNYTDETLTFEQKKTKHSATAQNCKVVLPLSAEMMALIGKPDDYGKGDADNIFSLPSHTMCLKALERWCKRAGIEQKVTWHCGRVTCATLLLDANTDVVTIQAILGHSSLDYINRYAKSRDARKRAAIEAMPKLNLNAKSK